MSDRPSDRPNVFELSEDEYMPVVQGTQEPFPVHGIQLLRFGDYVTVWVDTGDTGHGWVAVIRAHIDVSFSHIVEPEGIRAAIRAQDDTQKGDAS